jgi:peroxiredoxin Q/BCP
VKEQRPRICANFEAHEEHCSMVKEGDPAPDFDLETDEGTRVSLKSLEGKNVVLFFYPKDNTSG